MGAIRDVVGNFGQSTLRSAGSQQAYLAGVIQGEAKDPAGQFAVASTFVNRANSPEGFPGQSGGVVGIASAGSYSRSGQWLPQYSGYNPNYTPQAYDLAGAALSGNLDKYGNTGNATYYNAYGNMPAYDQGGSIIGGNSFSNVYQKPPNADYQAPVFGGTPSNDNGGNSFTIQNNDPYTTANGAAAAGDVPFWANTPYSVGQMVGPTGQTAATPNNFATIGDSQHFGLDGGVGSAATTPSGVPFNYDDGTLTGVYNHVPDADGNYVDKNGVSQLGDITVPANPSGTSGGASVGSGMVGTGQGSDAGGETPATASAVNPAQTTDTTADAGSNSQSYFGDMDVAPALDTVARSIAASTQSSNQATASAANTTAQSVNNLGQQVATAAQTQAAATSQLSNQIGQSTTQQTATAQDIKTTALNWANNIFVRMAIIVLGLIFVAVGLTMFKTVQQNVVKPIGRSAKRVAEVAAA